MTTRTMHHWKDDILQNFQIRKTTQQKTAFIEHLAEIYGGRMHVEESGKLIKSRNIVIGNPESASVIYTAHYDTCARLPFPNLITPKNFVIFLLYQLFVALVMLAPALVLSTLTASLAAALELPELPSLLLTELVLLIFMFAVVWLMMAGPANPHTANDNTSGVVTVLTLADRLADRNDLCFVLFDNEEIGLFGSADFAKKHRNVREHTLVVNFDCVSDGDWMMILSSKPAHRKVSYEHFCEFVRKTCASTEKLPLITTSSTAIYPSDQMNFKKYIAVAALKKTKTPLIGYYMNRIHTPKDTVFDDRNIELLTDLFAEVDRFEL